jgi:hypothetical protein
MSVAGCGARATGSKQADLAHFPRGCEAVYPAPLLHLWILATFGPLGLNWNNLVWPWIATMAVFDVLLLSQDVRGLGHGASVALFAVLPALSVFNLWDSYPSSVALLRQSEDGGPDRSRRSRRSRAASGRTSFILPATPTCSIFSAGRSRISTCRPMPRRAYSRPLPEACAAHRVSVINSWRGPAGSARGRAADAVAMPCAYAAAFGKR